MRIKKYIAKTSAIAKARIKEELGDDAAILSMRDIIVPPNREKSVEITVAIEKSNTGIVDKEEIGRQALESAEKARKMRQSRKSGQNSPRQLAQNAKLAYEDIIPSLHNPPVAAVAKSEDNQQIKDDLKLVKSMLGQIKEEMTYKHSGSLSPIFSKLYKFFIDNGISENSSLSIIRNISQRNISIAYDEVENLSRDLLVKKITLGGHYEKSNTCQPIFFTGTTGSGKTSSLIKIAVILNLIQKADILIVSADTYKVGSIEQLETFASIAGLPYKSAYTPEELLQIYNKENNRDFILIDTTGRSPFRKEYIQIIKEYVQAIKTAHVCYVQNCNTSSQNFMDSMEAFNILNPSSLILTKLDEVRSLASIIDTLGAIDLPLSYITTGQQIPDDIEPVDTQILRKWVLPETNNRNTMRGQK